MKPEILKISQISPDQSVICILGSDQIPDRLDTQQIRKGVCPKAAESQGRICFYQFL